MSSSLLAILLLCGAVPFYRICALMQQHQHNRPYVSCASLPITTSSSQQHHCQQQQQFHHGTVHHRHHQSSTLYSTPNSREVDMGIFGSSDNLKPTKKIQKRDAAAAVNGDVNGESSDDDYDGDDDKPGFVRGIIRRIRGRDGPDSGDDDSSSSSNSVLSRSKAIRSKTRSVTKKKKKKKAPQRVTKQVEQSQSPFLQLAQQAKAKNAAKKRAAAKKENKKEEAEASPSWTDRVTGWLSSEDEEEEGNSRKKEKRRKKAQRESDSNKETSSSSSNPLSVVQKLFKSKDSNNNGGNGNSKKRSKDEEEWVTVFPKTRISPGELVPVTVGGIDLLVIASNDGKNRLYCIANSCPHLGTPLELGQLVRLPVEDGAAGASTTTASSGGSGSSNSTLADKKPDSINGDTTGSLSWTETQVSSILQQDGCEDCIVCPLHRTAFALESGQVRGEWCPYPPIVGRMVGSVKKPTAAATFGVRLRRGRDVQVRINSPIIVEHDEEEDRPPVMKKIDQQRPKQQSQQQQPPRPNNRKS